MGRYIYNRVILENATVRAAAVTALAKFGAACIKLRQSTLTLLKRCLHDNDDEARPRTHCLCLPRGAAYPRARDEATAAPRFRGTALRRT